MAQRERRDRLCAPAGGDGAADAAPPEGCLLGLFRLGPGLECKIGRHDRAASPTRLSAQTRPLRARDPACGRARAAAFDEGQGSARGLCGNVVAAGVRARAHGHVRHPRRDHQGVRQARLDECAAPAPAHRATVARREIRSGGARRAAVPQGFLSRTAGARTRRDTRSAPESQAARDLARGPSEAHSDGAHAARSGDRSGGSRTSPRSLSTPGTRPW